MIRSILAYPHLFPVVMQILYVCALARYAYARDWARVIYWTGALIINASITFGRMK